MEEGREYSCLKRNRLVSRGMQRCKENGLHLNSVNQFITCWTLTKKVSQDWKKAKKQTEWSWAAQAQLLQTLVSMLWSFLGYSLHPSIHPVAGTPVTLKQWRLNHRSLQLIPHELHIPSCGQVRIHAHTHMYCTHTSFLSKNNMFSNLFSLHHPTDITRLIGKNLYHWVCKVIFGFCSCRNILSTVCISLL